MKNFLIIACITIALYSCGDDNGKADAYGNFESIETIISAESAGKIIKMDLEQGQELKKGDIVCIIDTTTITLKKKAIIGKKKSCFI